MSSLHPAGLRDIVNRSHEGAFGTSEGSVFDQVLAASAPTAVHSHLRVVHPQAMSLPAEAEGGLPWTNTETLWVILPVHAEAVLHVQAGGEATAILFLYRLIVKAVEQLRIHVEPEDLEIDELWAPTLEIDPSRSPKDWDTSTREGLNEIASWILSRRRELNALDSRLDELDLDDSLTRRRSFMTRRRGW